MPCCKAPKCLRGGIVKLLQKLFFAHGKNIAQRPLLHIGICVAVTIVLAFGMLTFSEESYGVRLWLSPTSPFRFNHDWLLDNFPRDIRVHSLLLIDSNENGNILQPKFLETMSQIREKVQTEVKTSSGRDWFDLCYEMPALNTTNLQETIFSEIFRLKRQTESYTIYDDYDDDE